MSLDLRAIRDAVKVQLQTVSGLRCYDTTPDNPQTPAAIVYPDEPYIVYDDAFGGSAQVNLKVRLIVQRVKADAAQDALDEYLSVGLGKSVADAIHDDRNLAGVVDDVKVGQAGEYGELTLETDGGLVAYGTATLTLLVLASL